MIKKTKEVEFDGGLYPGKYFASSSAAPWEVIDVDRFPNKPDDLTEFVCTCMSKATTNIGRPTWLGSADISYETGYDKFNNCYHKSFKGCQYGYAYWIKSYLPTSSYGYYAGFWKTAVTGSPIADVQHLSTVSALAANRAWWTMQPKFEGQISMINFLLELKDVKDLARHAYRIFMKLRGLRRFANRTLRKPRFSDPTKSAAEFYLEYQFGIAPLIRDLSTIWGQLGDVVRQAQEEFQALGRDDDLTRHYRETLAQDNSYSVGSKNNRFYQYGSRKKSVFTATMRYRYDYRLRNDFDAFMKFWGLSSSAAAIWEATPFSFLVDYFIKVGKAIHAMEVDPNVKVFAHDYCESIKTTFSSGTHIGKTDDRVMYLACENKSDPSTYLVESALVAGYEGTLYHRYRARPSKGLYVPKLTSGINSGQRTTIAALIRTML